MAYLGSLSDAELDALVDELATEQAREYYASMAQPYTPEGYAKVAAVFDAEYGSETDTRRWRSTMTTCRARYRNRRSRITQNVRRGRPCNAEGYQHIRLDF